MVGALSAGTVVIHINIGQVQV